METELEIIYSILNTIRNANHNGDEEITERLLRTFLKTYRADSIRKYYKDGHIVDDEVFQRIPLKMIQINSSEYIVSIPKVIRMTGHYGFYLEKIGISIPIVNSENYHLNKRNRFNKHLVQAKTESNFLTLFSGVLDSQTNTSADNGILISTIFEEVQNQETKTVAVDFFAVLNNPDDQPGYDWENDIYPFPAERLPELKGQILAKEFGIMVQAKKDEVSNGRQDSLSNKDEQEISG